MKNTTKHDIHRWIFEIPLEDVQNIEDTNTQAECECLLCGKSMKEDKVKQLVHLLTNGNLVSSDQDFDNSQGFFPVGNECKNKLPNNFIFKTNEN